MTHRMTLGLLAAALLCPTGNSPTAMAQAQTAPVNVSSQDSYGPGDPLCAGHRYRIETGHFGRFYNCDGEEDKRNSPWIHWKSVQRCETRRIGWSVLFHDIAEVRARVRNGRCCPTCWPDWTCPDCQASCGCEGPCGIGTNQALIMAEVPESLRRPPRRPADDASDLPGNSLRPPEPTWSRSGAEAKPADANGPSPPTADQQAPPPTPSVPQMPELPNESGSIHPGSRSGWPSIGLRTGNESDDNASSRRVRR